MLLSKNKRHLNYGFIGFTGSAAHFWNDNALDDLFEFATSAFGRT